MPTYEEALAANPAAFVDYASEMAAAGTDLTEHRAEYDSTVVEINAGWQDKANTAFNDDAVVVDEHVDQVATQVGEAAELLDSGGAAMQSMVEQLRSTDASYRGAGFNVQSEPRVELGAVHWAAIAAAGPFGPMLQALFQARADEGTVQLQLGLSVLTAADAATGAGLTAAAEQFEPLEDKGGAADPTICPPVVAEDDRTGRDGEDDQNGRDTTGQDDADPKKKSGDGDPESDKDKDADEKKNDDEDKQSEEDQEKDPQDQNQDQDETRQPTDPDQPGAVEPNEPTVPGYESPDPADYDMPDVPGVDTDWDPAELDSAEIDPAELPSGGLAGSGGGLGGGGGGAGLPEAGSVPTGGTAGPVGGVIGAPAGATGGPASTAGGRTGLGGMVGAPGARGAANPDDEFERESFLTEDPDEDVWGIGTVEDNPYVDYQEEQEAEAAEEPVFPSLLEDAPPILLPGFPPPEPGPNRT
ncbi:WXG100 family type VII secretion target [Glycomyces sp. MUSA5-2]|uniref:WXG100 family type VII secretion target n=1 Tax=Glycomyces sp. MUSA5-2 TaxID=2053002 RepID=UPI00300BF820